MDAFKVFEKDKIIPVVTFDTPDSAVEVARALLKGGINSIEVTFRTDAAAESLYRISSECTEMLVGAGTVLSVEMAKKAKENGARFIVSPGINPEVIDYCKKNDLTIIPGCATPTDMELAIRTGVNVVKFFPAEAFGGLKTLKAISAPYPNLKFLPTGGINEENIINYLSYEKVIACGGSWITSKDLIDNKEFKIIQNNAEIITKKIKGFFL